PTGFAVGNSLTLNLHTPDFTTATRVAGAINDMIGEGTAYALDGTSITVNAPNNVSQRVEFMSLLENFEVQPGEVAAKIVVNSRTGTIIIGQHVRVSPAAITHGNLTVTIASSPVVSQPGAFSDGQTVVVPSSDISVSEN